MREVVAFEAKNKLGQLLDEVEHREEIVITRRGKEVARLVRAKPTHSRADVHAAMQRIRARAESRRFGPFDWAEWKSWRDEGRP